ncbi:hypothetical protein SAMN05661080_02614 [Modestobacter sp. DSM 44400]|uniref:hypothetical protein n=1 Tax=Modestobacter sp. DSM 44400 TaxID=1550230 RepID=UPI00089604D8|nr:hypothetical protein [Modestobacter sp. DSM 44400]SDY18432.1 hypothetical protein SAMN05661080_02614 [Modestobacter sp. DSM 44400]
MSQPHPPRPEDQPAQQPSEPQGPRTQQIPVVQPQAPVTPAAPAPAPPPPGPAFSTEASWHPGGAHTAPPAPAPGPATTPPPPVPPAQMSPPSFRPQPVPPEQQVWPQPAAPQEPAPDAAWSARATGPVDFVPGFGTSAPPPAGSRAATTTGQLPAAGPAEGGPSRTGHNAKRLGAKLTGGLPGGAAEHRAVFAGLGLGVLGLVLLELGLARDFGNASLWSVVPTWSAFATVAAVVALLPLVARWLPGAPGPGTTWHIGLGAVIGLAAFWVLVALPLVASDRGFLLSAGLALAAAAVWLAPGRAQAGPGSGPGA